MKILICILIVLLTAFAISADESPVTGKIGIKGGSLNLIDESGAVIKLYNNTFMGRYNKTYFTLFTRNEKLLSLYNMFNSHVLGANVSNSLGMGFLLISPIGTLSFAFAGVSLNTIAITLAIGGSLIGGGIAGMIIFVVYYILARIKLKEMIEVYNNTLDISDSDAGIEHDSSLNMSLCTIPLDIS